MTPEITNLAKQLSLDLHHEAQLHRIVGIIERYLNLSWTDGFAEGFRQGREPLEEVEFTPLEADATGEP